MALHPSSSHLDHNDIVFDYHRPLGMVQNTKLWSSLQLAKGFAVRVSLWCLSPFKNLFSGLAAYGVSLSVEGGGCISCWMRT